MAAVGEAFATLSLVPRKAKRKRKIRNETRYTKFGTTSSSFAFVMKIKNVQKFNSIRSLFPAESIENEGNKFDSIRLMKST